MFTGSTAKPRGTTDPCSPSFFCLLCLSSGQDWWVFLTSSSVFVLSLVCTRQGTERRHWSLHQAPQYVFTAQKGLVARPGCVWTQMLPVLLVAETRMVGICGREAFERDGSHKVNVEISTRSYIVGENGFFESEKCQPYHTSRGQKDKCSLVLTILSSPEGWPEPLKRDIVNTKRPFKLSMS